MSTDKAFFINLPTHKADFFVYILFLILLVVHDIFQLDKKEEKISYRHQCVELT